MSVSKSIAIVVPNVLGAGLTGPAVRCLEMARELSRHFPVTLLGNRAPSFSIPAGVAWQTYGRADLGRRVGGFPIVISQGLDYRARYIATLRNVQIFDLYDPILFELIAGNVFSRTTPAQQLHYYRHLTQLLLQQGSYFLCASPQQRDLWLGALYAAGRLNEELYRRSPDGDALMGVIPFGHDREPPRKRRPVVKDVFPGISRSDRLLLWGGGIWNWFDTQVLLEAMQSLSTSRPDIKLLFLGLQHPNEEFAGGQRAAATRAASDRMGLTGKTVFFREGWVPFDELPDYLLEADLAVCTTPRGLENHFSFRTRLMDALWAKLPYVCTSGGFFADLADRKGIGLVVPPGDPTALADAMTAGLEPGTAVALRDAMERVWGDYTWERCLKPLVSFCESVDVLSPARVRPASSWYEYCSYTFRSKIEKYFY